jgi:hypothetical protein
MLMQPRSTSHWLSSGATLLHLWAALLISTGAGTSRVLLVKLSLCRLQNVEHVAAAAASLATSGCHCCRRRILGFSSKLSVGHLSINGRCGACQGPRSQGRGCQRQVGAAGGQRHQSFGCLLHASKA